MPKQPAALISPVQRIHTCLTHLDHVVSDCEANPRLDPAAVMKELHHLRAAVDFTIWLFQRRIA